MKDVTIPWDALASSNTRHTRKGGTAHGYGYKQAREAIYVHALDQHRSNRPAYPEEKVDVRLTFHAPDFRRRDEANYLKALLDGLQGVIYEDDWQVARLTYLRGQPDADNPRVEIRVQPMPERAA